MKIPSRLTLAIGTLIAGGAGLTQEISLSNPLHKVILLVAGVILFLLDPKAASAESALDAYPVLGSAEKASAPTPAASTPV